MAPNLLVFGGSQYLAVPGVRLARDRAYAGLFLLIRSYFSLFLLIPAYFILFCLSQNRRFCRFSRINPQHIFPSCSYLKSQHDLLAHAHIIACRLLHFFHPNASALFPDIRRFLSQLMPLRLAGFEKHTIMFDNCSRKSV
jgi:hypothetical protein